MLYHETMIVIRYVLPTFVLALNLVFPVELECLQTELGVFKHKKEEKPQPRKATKCFSKFWLNIRKTSFRLEKLSIFEERWVLFWREVRNARFQRFGVKGNSKQKRCEWNERPSCWHSGSFVDERKWECWKYGRPMALWTTFSPTSGLCWALKTSFSGSTGSN